jgi:hypothetical protein
MKNQKHRYSKYLFLSVILLASATLLVFSTRHNHPFSNIGLDQQFDGAQAMNWVEEQCALGYRITGSVANMRTAKLITTTLEAYGWQTSIQEFTYLDTPVRNLLAWKGDGNAIMLGAHYDTRRIADAENSSVPVLGANDGASGVAVLLELARVIEINKVDRRVYLAFFDAEDNGRLDDWDWIVGSSYMAAHWGEKKEPPLEQVIIVDMIGDKDLNIYWERHSDITLSKQIWRTAHDLGHDDVFIPEMKYSIYDDHIPFIQMGIPAIDIIDFDYPYWHTTEDTLDKVSSESLYAVGSTLETWLENPQKQ